MCLVNTQESSFQGNEVAVAPAPVNSVPIVPTVNIADSPSEAPVVDATNVEGSAAVPEAVSTPVPEVSSVPDVAPVSEVSSAPDVVVPSADSSIEITNVTNQPSVNVPSSSPVLTVPAVSQEVPASTNPPIDINATPITPTVDFSSLSSLE